MHGPCGPASNDVAARWRQFATHNGAVYTVRATKKLLDRLKVQPSPTAVDASTALGDWYATAIFWKPQVALFVNERTYLPVVVPLAPAASLIERFPAALAIVLDRLGIDPRVVAAERAAMADAAVAKTADRRALGVMNELVFQAKWRVDRGLDAEDLPALSVHLSGVLLGPLMKGDGPGSPDVALRRLVDGLLA